MATPTMEGAGQGIELEYGRKRNRKERLVCKQDAMPVTAFPWVASIDCFHREVSLKDVLQ